MSNFERDGATIHYEVLGEGFPVLLIAPGGMFSDYEKWNHMPWNPLVALADEFHVIAMDQRNAGRSTAPITGDDGWQTYTADQLGLIDHLGIDRFAVVGMCIGGPYIAGLIKAAPERVAAAVMLQPIGLDDNRQAFFDMFDGWRDQIAAAHPEADDATFTSMRANMYGGDFLFNTTRDEARDLDVPVLLLMGSDLYHPESTSRELAELLPDVRFIEDWKEGEALDRADEAIREFLAQHSG